MTDDASVMAYIRKNGLYAHLAAAAGVVKDLTAGDVHIPAADLKTPPAASAADVAGKAKKKPVVDMAKRLEAEALIFKGEANLYVSRPLLDGSAERLHDWAVEQGIKNIVPPELMHVTQVHSTAEVDTDAFKPMDTVLNIDPDSRWLSQLGKGNALVMFFASKDMQERFKEAAKAGASWDFPSYMPHVTLSYDSGADAATAWQMSAPPDMPLQLGPEEFTQSNSTWVDDNGLVEKGDGFETKFDFIKFDEDQHIIGGWASVATINGQIVIDKQGDIIPVDELEKAFHKYVMDSRQHGDMHESTGSGDLIACLTFTKAKEAFGLFAKGENGEAMEATWVEYKISDMGVWKRLRGGDLPEFSIGGRATPHTV